MPNDDNRIPLPPGTKIYIKESNVEYTICKLTGRGGSGLVYSAKERIGDNEQMVLLKEVYPNSSRFFRKTDVNTDACTDEEADKDDAWTVCADADDNEASIIFKRICDKLIEERILGDTAAGEISFAEFPVKTFVSENGNFYAVSNRNRPEVTLRELLNADLSSINLRACALLFSKIAQVCSDLHKDKYKDKNDKHKDKNKEPILHLDLNPGNILLRRTNDVSDLIGLICIDNKKGDGESLYIPIIIDFGCSVEYNGIRTMSVDNSPTSAFSAPELTDGCGQGISPATDVFSVVRCFEEFWGKCDHSIEEAYPAIRATVEEIIRIGTERARRRRYQSMTRLNEVLWDLVKLIDNNAVSKASLWEASRADFLKKLDRNGRFSGQLDIIEEILPLGKEYELELTGQADDAEQPAEVMCLIEAHSNKNINIIIWGEGGIGKTTALVKKLKEAFSQGKYDASAPVPIYIELNKAPAKMILDGDNDSSFILRYIASLLYCVKYSEVSNEVLESLREEFKKQNQTPDYLLLLDGLNEVSSDWDASRSASTQSILIDEIQKFVSESPNVKVIMTSRDEHIGVDPDDKPFTRIHLSGLDDDRVAAFLSGIVDSDNTRKFDDDAIAKALSNKLLMECLRVPLFLLMYSRIDAADKATTRGEILRAFWENAGEYYKKYYEKEGVIYSQRDVDETAIHRKISSDALLFIRNFIAAALCHEMTRKNEFQISFKAAKKIIKRILSDNSKFAILGEYGEECYNEFEKDQKGRPYTIADYAGFLAQDAITELVNMGILYRKEDNSYGVRHHYFRDYWAAVFVAQRLRLAVHVFSKGPEEEINASREILGFLREKPLNPEVMQLLGEYLGEHKNAPEQDLETGEWKYTVPDVSSPDDKNLIKRALDIYRGVFDDEDECSVYNLIGVLKKVRIDLSGEDFSRLDLRRCTLNGTFLGRRGCSANFSGAWIDHNNIFYEGHSDTIFDASYSSDGSKIITYSYDETIKTWDAKTLELLETHKRYVPDNTPIGRALSISPTDSEIQKLIAELESERRFSVREGLCLVRSASYSPNGKHIITSFSDGTVMIFDTETHNCVGTILSVLPCFYSIDYDNTGKYFITTSADKTAKIWNAQNYTLFDTIWNGYDMLKATYSQKGKYIVVRSFDNTTVNHWSLPLSVYNAGSHSFIGEIGDYLLDFFSLEGTEEIYSDDRKFLFIPNFDYISGVDGIETINIHNMQTGEIDTAIYGRHNQNICSPDEQYFIAFSDNSATVWNKQRYTLGNCSPENLPICIHSRDKKYYITVTSYYWFGLAPIRELMVKDFQTNEDICPVLLISKSTNSALSNDGKCCVKVWEDEDSIWSVQIESLVAELNGHSADIRNASYSPDGKFIATASDDGTVKIWDTEDEYKCIQTILNLPGMFILGCDFRNLHPDSDLSDDDMQLLWQYGAITDKDYSTAITDKDSTTE